MIVEVIWRWIIATNHFRTELKDSSLPIITVKRQVHTQTIQEI